MPNIREMLSRVFPPPFLLPSLSLPLSIHDVSQTEARPRYSKITADRRVDSRGEKRRRRFLAAPTIELSLAPRRGVEDKRREGGNGGGKETFVPPMVANGRTDERRYNSRSRAQTTTTYRRSIWGLHITTRRETRTYNVLYIRYKRPIRPSPVARESPARSANVLETIYAAGRAPRPTCLIWTRVPPLIRRRMASRAGWRESTKGKDVT